MAIALLVKKTGQLIEVKQNPQGTTKQPNAAQQVANVNPGDIVVVDKDTLSVLEQYQVSQVGDEFVIQNTVTGETFSTSGAAASSAMAEAPVVAEVAGTQASELAGTAAVSGTTAGAAGGVAAAAGISTTAWVAGGLLAAVGIGAAAAGGGGGGGGGSSRPNNNNNSTNEEITEKDKDGLSNVEKDYSEKNDSLVINTAGSENAGVRTTTGKTTVLEFKDGADTVTIQSEGVGVDTRDSVAVIDTGAGDDKVKIVSTKGDDGINTSDNGKTVIATGSGNDTVEISSVMNVNGGYTVLDGGEGNDTLTVGRETENQKDPRYTLFGGDEKGITAIRDFETVNLVPGKDINLYVAAPTKSQNVTVNVGSGNTVKLAEGWTVKGNVASYDKDGVKATVTFTSSDAGAITVSEIPHGEELGTSGDTDGNQGAGGQGDDIDAGGGSGGVTDGASGGSTGDNSEDPVKEEPSEEGPSEEGPSEEEPNEEGPSEEGPSEEEPKIQNIKRESGDGFVNADEDYTSKNDSLTITTSGSKNAGIRTTDQATTTLEFMDGSDTVDIQSEGVGVDTRNGTTTIDTGAGSDEVKIVSTGGDDGINTSANGKTVIATGSGDDTVEISSVMNVTGGHTVLDGGEGNNDTLTVGRETVKQRDPRYTLFGGEDEKGITAIRGFETVNLEPEKDITLYVVLPTESQDVTVSVGAGNKVILAEGWTLEGNVASYNQGGIEATVRFESSDGGAITVGEIPPVDNSEPESPAQQVNINETQTNPELSYTDEGKSYAVTIDTTKTGEDGTDIITEAGKVSSIEFGSGNDTLTIYAPADGVAINTEGTLGISMGVGDDKVLIIADSGTQGNDGLHTVGKVSIDMGDGADTLEVLSILNEDGGSTVLDGGAGYDTLILGQSLIAENYGFDDGDHSNYTLFGGEEIAGTTMIRNFEKIDFQSGDDLDGVEFCSVLYLGTEIGSTSQEVTVKLGLNDQIEAAQGWNKAESETGFTYTYTSNDVTATVHVTQLEESTSEHYDNSGGMVPVSGGWFEDTSSTPLI